MTSRSQFLLICTVGLVSAVGCASRGEIVLEGADGFARMPQGRTAVLDVTASYEAESKSAKWLWGMVEQASAAQVFAEQLAHAARQEGGLDVLTAREIRAGLRAAGLDPSLEADAGHPDALATALGCKSYLTADLKEYDCNYLVFWCWGRVRFDLSGYRVGEREPLWSAHVRRTVRGADSRQAARVALEEMFQKLSASRPSPPQGNP